MSGRAGSRVHIGMKLSVFLALAALLFVLGAGTAAAAGAAVGSPAPNWKLPDLHGKPVQLSDFKGKVVVLDFWATWCLPCVEEIPRFVDLQKKYQDKGVVFVGVAMFDTKPAVTAYTKKVGVNYPIVLGDDTVDTSYGAMEAFPTTMVLDRTGKVSVIHLGLFKSDDLESALAKLL